ncbi:hypothetical protein VNO77_20670 [Canavalia gladiata]|uniref:Uncharacterized protein n=1 Tax=Canavalia gladiata TaxID=3824 RepID=A0AAN9QJK2_CANGL
MVLAYDGLVYMKNKKQVVLLTILLICRDCDDFCQRVLLFSSICRKERSSGSSSLFENCTVRSCIPIEYALFYDGVLTLATSR